MSWLIRLPIALVGLLIIYFIARWADRSFRKPTTTVGGVLATLGLVLMVPTKYVLVFAFNPPGIVAATLAGLVVGLLLAILLAPLGIAGAIGAFALRLPQFLAIFGSAGAATSILAGIFRTTPVSVFSPVLWGALIFAGVFVILISRIRLTPAATPAALPNG